MDADTGDRDTMALTRIACVQMDCELGNPETNRQNIVRLIAAAAESSASLAIFPECAITGYCFESRQEAVPFAEKADGPSASMIAEACQKSGLFAVVGFIESDGDRLFNAAMVVGPRGLVGVYRKTHLPFLGIDRFLDPGDAPFQIFELPIGKIGINICYDISFPEAARELKLLGAELIVIPTNWPRAAWRTPEFVLNARAIENHVNVAAANRVGVERGWQFIGRSKMVDVNGDTVCEAGGSAEEMLIGELDLALANQNRIVNVAGSYEIDRLADRRPELYTGISARKTHSKTIE